MSSFMTHKNIGYRLMSPAKLASAVDISISQDPCVWNRIFLMYRGLSEDELSAFEGGGAGVKEAARFDWRSMVGWTEAYKDTKQLRVGSSLMILISFTDIKP